MRITNILWILPFISFMGGYFLIQTYFGKTRTTVPCLIGKQLNEAVCTLSDHMLVARIIAEKEDRNLPVGTIIQQKPEPQTSIRCHQTIMLTVSKLPDPLQMPLVVGKNLAEIMPQLLKMELQPQVYELEADEVLQGTCIAQWPSSQQEIKPGNKLILYCAKNIKKPYIVPSFIGKRLEDAKQVCEKHAIVCQVIHAAGTDYTNRVVIAQRPLPGTLLMLDAAKKILFQFQV